MTTILSTSQDPCGHISSIAQLPQSLLCWCRKLLSPHRFSNISYKTKAGYFVRAYYSKKGVCLRKDYFRSYDSQTNRMFDLLISRKNCSKNSESCRTPELTKKEHTIANYRQMQAIWTRDQNCPKPGSIPGLLMDFGTRLQFQLLKGNGQTGRNLFVKYSSKKYNNSCDGLHNRMMSTYSHFNDGG